MVLRAEIKIYDNSKTNASQEVNEEITLNQSFELEGGANKHQKALLFNNGNMADFKILNGEKLTFNEIKTLTLISNVLSDFFDIAASVIVNQAAICGVSLAPTVEEACVKVFDCDPASSLGGAIGFSKKVNLKTAEYLKSMCLKLIVAPDYDQDALNLLNNIENLTIVKLNTPLEEYKSLIQNEVYTTPFGTLYQDSNKSKLTKSTFKIVTKTKPTKEQIEDVVFAWNVAKHLRSNGIVIAKDFKTHAIVQGFSSSVNATEYAMDIACENSKDAILASDNTLCSAECINAAIQGRISLIIQPGGSDNDSRLIKLADKYNIAMIFTGIKNYKY